MVSALDTAPSCVALNVRPCEAEWNILANKLSKSKRRKMRDRRVAIRHSMKHSGNLQQCVPFLQGKTAPHSVGMDQMIPENENVVTVLLMRICAVEAMLADLHGVICSSGGIVVHQQQQHADKVLSELNPRATVFIPAENDDQLASADAQTATGLESSPVESTRIEEDEGHEGAFEDKPASKEPKVVKALQHKACEHVTTWPHARLSGLKTGRLNGRVGEILSVDSATGRCGFLLHGDSEPKSVKPSNLIPYRHTKDDVCKLCSDPINLCVSPPCGCTLPISSAPISDITGAGTTGTFMKMSEEQVDAPRVVSLTLSVWRYKTGLTMLSTDCIKRMDDQGGFFCPKENIVYKVAWPRF